MLFCALIAAAFAEAPPAPRTMAEVLAASAPADWRPLDPENTLYLDLAQGRVIVRLAPEFAPRHVANIKALVREGYFNGLAFMRAQDNYVVQFGDVTGKRPIRTAQRTLAGEFARPSKGVALTPLADRDTYAPQVGWVEGFPVARDGSLAWLAHCYGMVGAGRDDDADSGGGAEVYVVIGHAPRHLDRNVTLVGRVVQGMDLLSVLPRGAGAMGFYERPGEHVPIARMRVAADVPAVERSALELLRTDTPTFAALIAARRNRTESWFKAQAGGIDLCNVPLPVRPTAVP